MIDIHSHILPGVDDGSKGMEMSIKMAKMYLDNGIKRIIATPHYIDGIKNNSIEKNMMVVEGLKKELQREEIDIEISLGNEVLVSLEILKGLQDKKINTLNSSRYILIELPMFDIPIYVEDMLYEIMLKGYIPVLAHPERNTKIIENPNILYSYIKNGVLAQLNLPSLEGKYGGKIKGTAEILLKHNMIHFLGTDTHNDKTRTPNINNALERLKSIVTPEKYIELTYKNAECLIGDKLIEIDFPIEYKKPNWFVDLFMNKIGVF